MWKKLILVILGVISILYGMMILGVGSGTNFWLMWEAIGGAFLVWAFLVHIRFFASHKIVGKLFCTMVVIGIVTISVLSGLIATEFRSKGQANLDYIIVLGAQVRDSGPSVILKYRLDAAIEYLSENTDTVCIVSGGKGVNEPFSEAEGMADYLIKKGLDPERILLEDQSRNTVENILNSKALLNSLYQNVGIVTNNFHVFRAVQIAKAQGLKEVCGIAAESNIFYLPNNGLRECLGILKDWVFGNI
jgi:uncharacterized SAM-binding protein YcdF (DUF218 family)